MMAGSRILVALSGGVDSSVSAILLKQMGYELIGLSLKTWLPPMYKNHGALKGIRDATILCNKLGIPYFVEDVSSNFKTVVADQFTDSYLNGQTPNPCALCNPQIKWSSLIEIADKFACEYIATGHYAQIVKQGQRYCISTATDSHKDQSYFLWGLGQHQLSRTTFPLADLNKTQVKQLADGFGLTMLAKKKESYNICFIPEGDYRSFFKFHNLLGESEEAFGGTFVSETGEELGHYTDIWAYTVGQKKGIIKQGNKPLYVKKIDASNKQILLAEKEKLSKTEVVLNPINFMLSPENQSKYDLLAKCNYKSPFEPCSVQIMGNEAHLQFRNPIYALTPGQSVAIYKSNLLIGGGIIKQ
jgi:tRNA-uridine 2-sulfurtransferase